MVNGKSWALLFRTLVLLFVLTCATSVFAQDNKCSLKLAELPASPELFGFRLGMSTGELKQRVPQVVFAKEDDFGISKTSISPDFDPKMDKASLTGVRTVSFDFLDGRLTSLWLGYDSSFKWNTVPDFVAGISKSLHLPDAWEPWKVRGQQLSCEDFQMTISIVAEGASFHIIDETAEKTVVARREAKEEQDAALEESQANEIVADTLAKIYYPQGCAATNEIKEKDRIVFKTAEEAEKAGYKPAKACQ
jgi:hypothetical protein